MWLTVKCSSVLGSSSTREQSGTMVKVSWRNVGSRKIDMTRQCHSKRKGTLRRRSKYLLEYKSDVLNATEDLVV